MWCDKWTHIYGKLKVVSSGADEKKLLNDLLVIKFPTVLGFVNAHAMNSIVTNDLFFHSLASADILLRDGSGMALLYKRKNRDAGLNMNGTDFIPKILAAYRDRRVALWGTEEPFLSLAAARAENEFGVKMVSVQHGFKKADDYCALAKKDMPELIVLGMGMPKQEQVAAMIRSSEIPALIVCGGAIIDFLGGKVNRAPLWAREIGIEWLYRLLFEPKRLFMRYIIGNPLFIVRLLCWF